MFIHVVGVGIRTSISDFLPIVSFELSLDCLSGSLSQSIRYNTYMSLTAWIVAVSISFCRSSREETSDGSCGIWPSRYLPMSSLLARTSRDVHPSNNFSISGMCLEVTKMFAVVSVQGWRNAGRGLHWGPLDIPQISYTSTMMKAPEAWARVM